MSHKNPIMEYGRTLLHCAAMTGKFEICKYLIEDRVNLHPKDKEGCTPLGYAIQYGHLSVCKLIIENFNDKNPTSKTGWSKAIETGMILLIDRVAAVFFMKFKKLNTERFFINSLNLFRI